MNIRFRFVENRLIPCRIFFSIRIYKEFDDYRKYIYGNYFVCIYRCRVFLNNDVDLYTFRARKDFNYYLRPFSTMIRLTRLSKSKKKIFHKSSRNPTIHSNTYRNTSSFSITINNCRRSIIF